MQAKEPKVPVDAPCAQSDSTWEAEPHVVRGPEGPSSCDTCPAQTSPVRASPLPEDLPASVKGTGPPQQLL